MTTAGDECPYDQIGCLQAGPRRCREGIRMTKSQTMDRRDDRSLDGQ